MLLTRHDLAELIVNKPVIDARTDPTKPPTGVVDLATNTYSPIVQTRPLSTTEKVVLGVGIVGALGAVLWLTSKLPRSSYYSAYDEPVIVRRRRPVVVVDEVVDEPISVVDEAPAVLVNPLSMREANAARKLSRSARHEAGGAKRADKSRIEGFADGIDFTASLFGPRGRGAKATKSKTKRRATAR